LHNFRGFILAVVINDNNVVHIIRHGIDDPADQQFFVISGYNSGNTFVFIHGHPCYRNSDRSDR